MTERSPIPVERLVEQVCDGSDYADGVDGYCGGRYDEASGILTLRFQRCNEGACDSRHGGEYEDAEYHFQLIAFAPPVVTT